MSTWMSRAALEYIGQGGMGYQFDALDTAKTNKYHDAERNRAVSPTTQAGGRTRDLRDGGSTCHGSHQHEKGAPLCLQPPPSLALALPPTHASSQPFGGDPTVARGAPPTPEAAADFPDGRPRPHGRHPLG